MSAKATDRLWTPEYILDAAMEVFRVDQFGLDPCWNPGSKVRARVCVTAEQDSLREASLWEASPVWLNPPYSKPGPFLERMAYAVGRWSVDGIALVKHDHSTRWWQSHCRGRTMCMLDRRPKFGGLATAGAFPSTLVLFSDDERVHVRFALVMQHLGEVRA